MPLDEELRFALQVCGSPLAPGLTTAEISGVQARYGFTFPPDMRRMLQLALPVGDQWPDWRNGEPDQLRRDVAWPTQGILFDVESNGFWHPDWPSRPESVDRASSLAREVLAAAPVLVPVYGHRYLPSEPSIPGNPVLSVCQTDVICCGTDLLDWLRREFRSAPASRAVPFWTWFVEDGQEPLPDELPDEG